MSNSQEAWRFKASNYFCSEIIDADGRAVCSFEKDPDKKDAQLMTAAPEMLAALRRAVLALAFAAETHPAMRDDYNAVSAAIAKATGATHD